MTKKRSNKSGRKGWTYWKGSSKGSSYSGGIDWEDDAGTSDTWLSQWEDQYRAPKVRVHENDLKVVGERGAVAVRVLADEAKASGRTPTVVDSYVYQAARRGFHASHERQLKVYDRTLREWAETYAVNTLGMTIKASTQYAQGIVASAALDILPWHLWVAYADHYLPPDGPHKQNQNGEYQSYALESERVQTASSVKETGGKGARGHDRTHMKQATDASEEHDNERMEEDMAGPEAGTEAAGCRIVNYIPFNPPASASELAASLEDARREALLSDWSGSDLGNDVALWAAGAGVSPFADAQPRLTSTVDCVVLVDASSSTLSAAHGDSQTVAVRLAEVAMSLAAALRGAGHGCAVIPWAADHYSGLEARPGRILWSDPLPQQWPVYGYGGTRMQCASMASRLAFRRQTRKARRISIVLTDGCVDGRPREDCNAVWDFGSDLTMLWTIGHGNRAPSDWEGHALHSDQPQDMMADLQASGLIRYLSGLSG